MILHAGDVADPPAFGDLRGRDVAEPNVSHEALPLQFGKDAVPDARFDPAVEAGGEGLPRTVRGRGIAPGGARALRPGQSSYPCRPSRRRRRWAPRPPVTTPGS